MKGKIKVGRVREPLPVRFVSGHRFTRRVAMRVAEAIKEYIPKVAVPVSPYRFAAQHVFFLFLSLPFALAAPFLAFLVHPAFLLLLLAPPAAFFAPWLRLKSMVGDRNWTDTKIIRRELSRFPKGTRVIHGAARGADEIAGRVATELGFEVMAFPADWPKYGRAAGPIRNQKMLEFLMRQDPEEPKLVLAFHRNLGRSRGTADMVKRARSAGVEVKIIKGISKKLAL